MSYTPKKLSIKEVWEIYLDGIKENPNVPKTVKIMYPKVESISVEEYMNRYITGLYVSGYPEFVKFIEAFKNVS
jgi:hypothetical protein